METEELKQKIITTIAWAVGVRELEERHSYEELDIDSIDEVEIIEAMEDRFNVEISDEEAEKVKTVGDMVSLVMSKRL